MRLHVLRRGLSCLVIINFSKCLLSFSQPPVKLQMICTFEHIRPGDHTEKVKATFPVN